MTCCRQYLLCACLLWTFGTGALPAAFTINLDFSADASTDNFFSLRPAARAAVQQAADDLSAVLSGTNLTALSSSGTPNATDITGTFGSTSMSASWQFDYSNPSTGAATSITAPSVSANSVTIFVGMNKISGSTLGAGSPAGATLSLMGSGFDSELVNATAAMESLSNNYMGRGCGPTIGTLTGSIDFGGSTSANFSLGYGAAYGTLWFDQDTNNDNVNDSLAQLDAFWHYDATTPVAAGKTDLYSVALHEMIHALGAGASDNWTSQVTGTTWWGSHMEALNGGSGAGLISADGDHLAEGLMSTNIYTGLAQEVAMDPSLATGTRKQLTAMDVALLEDLNWTAATTPVPEPGTLLLGLSTGAMVVLRRRTV